MAHSTSSTFNGSKQVGVPQVAGAFDKFEAHATPKFVLGYKVESGDGSVYRYSHFGDDTNRGQMVSQDLSESSVVDTDDAVIAPASCVTTTDGTLGSKYLQMTLASVTVDQYAGAKFVTTDDTGEGYTYDIVGNTATDDPATGDIRIQLAQPLQVALDATTDVAILGSRYSNLEASTTTDVSVAGVACSTMDVSVAAYGWIQSEGDVGVLTEGTVVLGSGCITAPTDAGAVAPAVETDILERVGICKVVGDDTGHSIISLTLN